MSYLTEIQREQKVHVIVAGLTCGGPFPGPGSSSEHRVSMNPMREFIHHDDSQL